MDERIVRFIAALRGTGVRVSLAESQDAFAAAQIMGVTDRQQFKEALKTTLVKERRGAPAFEELFPLYFGTAEEPPAQPREGLSEQGRQALAQALQALADELRERLERALDGRPFSTEQLERAAQPSPHRRRGRWDPRSALERSMMQELGVQALLREIEQLLTMLEELGMSEAERADLRTGLMENYEALKDQVRHHAGLRAAEERAERNPLEPILSDLLERPLQSLTQREAQELEHEARRMANRLRTRLALRQRRGKGRRLDAKATLRTSLRHGSVPFELIHRTRRRKARFTLICDVSTSMRPVVSFLLLLMYQIQAEVSRTRSFAFIDNMQEISGDFRGENPEVAVPAVLRRIPPGHYNTDLGRSLAQFRRDHPSAVDRRTTLILCGDGRNNYNDPRLDVLEDLTRSARKVIWFNPEPPPKWGRGDSDMHRYAPLVEEVFQVANLRQLSHAVDQILL